MHGLRQNRSTSSFLDHGISSIMRPRQGVAMIFPSYEFKGNEFVEAFKTQLDKYIFLRVAGRSSRAALRVAFGEDYANHLNAQSYIDHIECTMYYMRAFKQALVATPIDQLWNKKIAIHRLLSLTEDPMVKENICAMALKELNILLGITVEENDKLKPRRTLADFYKSTRLEHAPIEVSIPSQPESGDSAMPTRH